MWTLILTLVSPYTSAATSIGTVPGFKSNEACHAAADVWIAKIVKVNGYAQPVAVCAKLD